MMCLEDQKSIIRQSIAEFLLVTFPNDDLQEILSGKIKDFDSFRNLVADSLVETLEEIRSEKRDSSYIEALNAEVICDRKHLAEIIRNSVVARWSNLDADAFDGARENDDGTIMEDFATFMAEGISHFLQTQPDRKYLKFLETEKRTKNKFLWYWLDGLFISLKLFLISLVISVIMSCIGFGIKLYVEGPGITPIGLIMVSLLSITTIVFLIPLAVNFLVSILGFQTTKSNP